MITSAVSPPPIRLTIVGAVAKASFISPPVSRRNALHRYMARNPGG